MSQTPASAVYEGRIRHRRFEPFEREFSVGIFMLYLDLEEIPDVMAIHPLWSTRRRSPARFRRADYLGPDRLPLRDAVAELVEARTGSRPDGPIRMLTHLRYWGAVENPVTFYYCFDRGGEKLMTVVAEVTNVPWGDRHAYVVEDRAGSGKLLAARTHKKLHVSPLMSMDHEYDLRFAPPGATLPVHMTSSKDGRKVFDATLNLKRTEITRPVLSRLLLRRPPMSLKVLSGIYLQAALNFARGARYHRRRQELLPPEAGRTHQGESEPGARDRSRADLPDRAEAAMLCPVTRANGKDSAGSSAARIR